MGARVRTVNLLTGRVTQADGGWSHDFDMYVEPDGVWTALFPDRLLLMNIGDEPVDVERTWNGRTIRRHLKAGELAEVPHSSR